MVSGTILTLKDLFRQSTDEFRNILAFKIRVDENYVDYSYGDIRAYATGLMRMLKELGIGKNDKVAILSENRPQWPMAYFAVTAMGAVAVPLDSMGAASDLQGIIKHSESKVLIFSDKFLDFAKGSGLKLISMDRDFEEAKRKASDDLGYDVTENDTASIVYTSGTTGIPKGVMLSHRNLVVNMMTAVSLFDIGPTDRLLSVLPLHHTLETMGMLAPFYCGASVTYSESLKSFKLLQNMADVKPTILIGVPMMFQLFYDGIMREVSEKKPAVRIIFAALLGLSRLARVVFRVNIGKKLFGTVQEKFGGSFRFWVSGGAAISKELLLGLNDLGFLVIQGYGLTESSPVIAANSLWCNRFGSVGKPIPGVSVRIENGEIVASGPNIMQGYFKMKEETDKVLKDGWLYTGDVGHLDKAGFLYITRHKGCVHEQDA